MFARFEAYKLGRGELPPHVLDCQLLAPGGRALKPEPVETAGADDRKKPGPDRAKIRTVQMGLCPHLEEYLLENFLGDASLAQNPGQQPKGGRSQMVEERGECVLISTGSEAEQG